MILFLTLKKLRVVQNGDLTVFFKSDFCKKKKIIHFYYIIVFSYYFCKHASLAAPAFAECRITSMFLL